MQGSSRRRTDVLNDEVLLKQLQELAESLGRLVRYENITIEESSGRGGICCVQGKHVLIVHSQATVKEKIRVITKSLKRFDFGDIYVKPFLRVLLEGSQE